LGLTLPLFVGTDAGVAPQWLFDTTTVSLAGGALLSVATAPFLWVIGYRNYRHVGLGAAWFLGILSILALIPLGALALYVAGLASIWPGVNIVLDRRYGLVINLAVLSASVSADRLREHSR
jgi:hypothetical protein